jgi:DNA-binding transcriptional regulator YdaS (Cro superfamily)
VLQREEHVIEGEKLRSWIEAHGETQAAFAARCGLSRVNLSYAMGSIRQVTRPNADAIERATNGEISAELLFRQFNEAKVAKREQTEDTPPKSGPREFPTTDLGSTPDEIRASIRRSKAMLAKGGLSATQHAAIEGKILSGLGALARLEERAKIEDHPDFPGVLDLVLVALERTLRQLGVNPNGARSVFADHLEAAEAEQQRRAA